MRRSRFAVLGWVLFAGASVRLARPDVAHAEEARVAATEPCPPGSVFVAGGTVTLGSPGDADGLPPATRATRAFCIDKTEVTVARYRACAASGVCPPPGTRIEFPGYGPPEPMRTELSRFCNASRDDRGEHPANCIDAATAATFCAWEGGRLPDEAEWELAARGPTGGPFPWGAAAPEGRLCWDRRVSGQGTCAVGSFPSGASASGALDMAGNVWEWTSSVAAEGPGGPGGRVVRGGGWTNFLPRLVTATYRWPLPPTTRLNCLGFRCVRPAS